MSIHFEELDYRPTPIGAISLRRRRDPRLDQDVYEIKLGEEFLMSSMFTASEIALARLCLAELPGDALDVVVGGLGLGYTAKAVLEHDTVGSLLVVDALDAVLDWHRQGLVPLGAQLTEDPRCRFLHADFYALTSEASGLGTGRLLDAVLVDIDHSPEALLDPGSASFYSEAGLRRLTHHLKPGGVFGLWSNDRPEEGFTARLASVFASARAEPVTFHNPLQDRPFTQTVYVARTATDAGE